VTLKNAFPRLFSISSTKDAKVAELGFWSNGVWVWQLAWRRQFFEWEKPLVDQLSQFLLKARIASGEVDSWIWNEGGTQSFSVNSAYNLVRKDSKVNPSLIFRKLWSCKAVPSAVLIAWRLMENKLATRVNLSRRGVLVVNSLCSFCGKEEETCRHLFFDCSFAWQVWCKCFRWLGVLVVSHIEPKNNFDQFRMSLASEKVNSDWNITWVGVVSEIWNHRNNFIFKRGVADASEVFSLVQVNVWSWVSLNFRSALFSFSDWCLEPMLCMRLIF